MTPPETSISSSPSAHSNSSSAAFSFTANETGSTFECNLDAGGWSACSSPQSYTNLSEGSHAFEVRATDVAVNTDFSPASYSWNVDLTSPETTITANPPELTTSTSAAFEFYASEAAVFECKLDLGAWVSCDSPRSYENLADGSHTFKVRAIDLALNADNAPAEYVWVVDTTPPQTSITSNPVNPTNATSATFEFSSNEAGSTFECNLDAAGWSPCSSPSSYSGLSEGSHAFKVRATDLAGLTDATPAEFSWVIDLTPPETTITNDPGMATILSDSATFEFISSEAGSTFECSLDDAPFSSCGSPKIYDNLAFGQHLFKARAIDPAGNFDGAPEHSWFVIDP